MTNEAAIQEQLRDRVRKRLDYRMIAEPESTEGLAPDLLTTDVVDWFMLRAPRLKFEICSLKIAFLQAMEKGRAQSGEYTIYCGGGTAVVCGGKSALLLLGYERIRELLRYLDHELEQASRGPWDDLMIVSLKPAQPSSSKPPRSRLRKTRNQAKGSSPAA